MTCTHSTPQTRTVSTPATTDDFRYRYAKTEMVVLADPRLTQNDKSVYSVIKGHRNHRSGTAWPSRATIAAIAGCTENHVTKSTRRLVEAGYLLKEQRPGRATVFRFPLADTVATTPIQTDWGERPTPIQTDGHNRQKFFEQTKQQQQPAGGDVVVVDSAIAKENFCPLRVGGGEAAPAAPDATPGTQAVPAAPDATPGTQAVPAAPDATPGTQAVPAAPDATPGTQAAPAGTDATPGTQAVPAGTDPGFTFPAIISLAMQVGIAKILCGLPYADAQMLLDELAGAAQHTTIRNPIAYLRRLLSLHLSGTLIPEHAERIAALRAAQARNEAARQRALNMRPGERPPDTPKKPRDHSAREAAMAAMRAALFSP
jgi:hypothetical protein